MLLFAYSRRGINVMCGFALSDTWEFPSVPPLYALGNVDVAVKKFE